MPRWDKAAILAEISRQVGWRAATIGRLQGERDYCEYKKAGLLARRAKYQAKNNGKGRPPKKIPEFTREKQGSLSRAKVEAAFLSDLFPSLAAADRPLALLEQRLLDMGDIPHPSGVKLFQIRLLKSLIRQFLQEPQPYQAPLEWSERDVRRYFELARKLHRRKMGYLARVTLHSDIERLEYDRHQAMSHLLDQVLASNHLSNAARLAQVLNVWRFSPPALEPQIPSRRVLVWNHAVDRLWSDLAAVFVTEGSFHG